jgi:hypothetical protein
LKEKQNDNVHLSFFFVLKSTKNLKWMEIQGMNFNSQTIELKCRSRDMSSAKSQKVFVSEMDESVTRSHFTEMRETQPIKKRRKSKPTNSAR